MVQCLSHSRCSINICYPLWSHYLTFGATLFPKLTLNHVLLVSSTSMCNSFTFLLGDTGYICKRNKRGYLHCLFIGLLRDWDDACKKLSTIQEGKAKRTAEITLTSLNELQWAPYLQASPVYLCLSHYEPAETTLSSITCSKFLLSL